MELLQTTLVSIRNRKLPCDKILHIRHITLYNYYYVCIGVYVGAVFLG